MTRLEKELRRVLLREQDCLERGDFDGALALAQKGDVLIGRIGDGVELSSDVAQTAERTLALVTAARAGLAAAQARVASMRDGAPTSTYAKDGARTEIGSGRSEVERRA